MSVLTLGAVLAGSALSTGAKRVFDRPRPPLGDAGITLLVALPDSYSFPSGHATTAFAAAAAVAVLQPSLRHCVAGPLPSPSPSRGSTSVCTTSATCSPAPSSASPWGPGRRHRARAVERPTPGAARQLSHRCRPRRRGMRSRARTDNARAESFADTSSVDRRAQAQAQARNPGRSSSVRASRAPTGITGVTAMVRGGSEPRGRARSAHKRGDVGALGSVRQIR